MTSSENKELVQRIMGARARGDRAPFIAAMADDFVWCMIGSTAWSGEYVGKTNVQERLFSRRGALCRFAGPWITGNSRYQPLGLIPPNRMNGAA